MKTLGIVDPSACRSLNVPAGITKHELLGYVAQTVTDMARERSLSADAVFWDIRFFEFIDPEVCWGECGSRPPLLDRILVSSGTLSVLALSRLTPPLAVVRGSPTRG